MHVLVKNCGHLQFLNGAYATLGEHDENRDVLFPPQAIDGGGAGITTSGTDYSEVMTILKKQSAHEFTSRRERREGLQLPSPSHAGIKERRTASSLPFVFPDQKVLE